MNQARLQLAKPHATVIVIAGGADRIEALAATNKAFHIASKLDGEEVLGFYSHKELENGTTTNGVSHPEVVIIQPPGNSTKVQEFSSSLEKALQQQGHSVSIESWTSEFRPADVTGKILISLVELEKSILDKLSKQDFENLRTVVLNCERLLWITHGDDPSLGMVDGFSRCISSEIASIKFQLLHLSENSGLQHGARLATEILDSSSSDNEYREVDGSLQVARISKSLTQNDLIRAHLEDSTRPAKLAEQRDDLRLTIGKPGLLDTLRFVPDERMIKPLADDEVEIQVKATGLK